MAKSVAAGGDRLPESFHGKEGVDGSSPSEGFDEACTKGLDASRRAPAAVDAVGAPRDGQQSTQTELLGAERFPDVSTALSTTSVNPMPWTVQYAIVELPPMMLSG